MDTSYTIRPFEPRDATAVRTLFIQVNRALAPSHLKDAFEAYITLSLNDEMGRIADYYDEKDGGFWVAEDATVDSPGTSATDADDPVPLLGMFGLEPSRPGGMELRRMYVDPGARRRGIARLMLSFAEQECRRRGMTHLDLSTSELQAGALALYRQGGYRLVREEKADAASNKTIGTGIRRYHFTKRL